MAIDDLIKAVEVSAQERISEIMERSRAEADELIREAQVKDQPIKKRLLEEATQSVAIQRNKMLSAAREKSRMEVINAKNEIFQKVFEKAEGKLKSLREHPHYREILKAHLEEALQGLGSEDAILHIDQRDEGLVKDIMSELKVSCEIIADTSSSGGLNVNTRDERFMVFNTLETRLKRAKDIYRPEIFSVLFGE
jgi:vacuolar-type H+-ATPase subunit E/Vma4